MLYGPIYSFHIFDHLYHIACVVHGFLACDACFWGFEEKYTVLAKMMFDGRMPQVNDGSGSAVIVQIGVVLQLDGALVYRRGRVTNSHMYMYWGVIPMVHHLGTCCVH
jgi:hypothetical protein